jgi:hypothetical protein
MIEKKAKGKAGAKKGATTKNRPSTRRNKKKELNPVGTWKDVAMLVESHARAMASAVIEEGEKGVSPVKFLFEVAKIGPPPEGTETTEEEESLAKTLFRTLNIPMTPVAADQYDAEDTVVIPANASVQKDEEKDEENTESDKVGV